MSKAFTNPKPFVARITVAQKLGAIEVARSKGTDLGWFFSTSGMLMFESVNPTAQYQYVWKTNIKSPVAKVVYWYDRRTRSWVVQLLDAQDNQIDDAMYSGNQAGRDKDIVWALTEHGLAKAFKLQPKYA